MEITYSLFTNLQIILLFIYVTEDVEKNLENDFDYNTHLRFLEKKVFTNYQMCRINLDR